MVTNKLYTRQHYELRLLLVYIIYYIHIYYTHIYYTNLELLKSLNALLLLESSMYAAGREVAVFKQLVELAGTGYFGHKDHYLYDVYRGICFCIR